MTAADVIESVDQSPAVRAKVKTAKILSQVAAVVLLILSLPMWPIIGMLVLSSLGKPVFYHQSRHGQGNRIFSIRKFRTMRNATGASGSLLPDSCRLTPIGRLLRRTRLDEMPQLLAIAGGAMAFVGPRPLFPETIAAFGDLGKVRCSVRPGLTGWAQVNGNTLLTDTEKLALDLWYIEHRSVWLDMKIILMTVLVPFRGERINAHNVSRAADNLIRRHRHFEWRTFKS